MPDDQRYVEHDGALVWYSTFCSGWPVIMLHGGLGEASRTLHAECGGGVSSKKEEPWTA
jgi:hypothetical protein